MSKIRILQKVPPASLSEWIGERLISLLTGCDPLTERTNRFTVLTLALRRHVYGVASVSDFSAETTAQHEQI